MTPTHTTACVELTVSLPINSWDDHCVAQNPVLKDVFAFSRPDHAGPGHPRAQLHHHQRGVQAQQTPPLCALWTAGSWNQRLSGDGQRETGRGERCSWKANSPSSQHSEMFHRWDSVVAFCLSAWPVCRLDACVWAGVHIHPAVCAAGGTVFVMLFITWRGELAEEHSARDFFIQCFVF